MNNQTNRSILSISALIIFMFIGFFLYNNIITGDANKKIDNVQIKNLLKNLKTDADLYYTSNNSYGDMPVKAQNGDCNIKNTFLENSLKEKIFSKINNQDMKCYFDGGGKIDRWSVTIKSDSEYLCIDEGGNTQNLNSFAQSSACN
jgi:hypothetical protein